MNQKSQIFLLQMVKAMKASNWTSDNQWELSLKADGNVPLVRPVLVQGELDGDKWNDQVHTMIKLSIATDDEITFFPEFSVYAQIAIGSIAPKDIEYKTAGNVAFTDKDLKNEKKFLEAAHEINRILETFLDETYQDYVDTNEELVRFYKQSNNQEK